MKAERLQRQYNDTLSAATSPHSTDYARPKGSPTPRGLDDYIIKLGDLSARIIDLKADAVEAKLDIVDALANVPGDAGEALTEIYILDKAPTRPRILRAKKGIPALREYLIERGFDIE